MCGGYLTKKVQSGMLCPACLASLPRTEQARLRQNETEMVLAMPLERAAAFLFFEKEDSIALVIHAMKYADQPEIGYVLGRQAAMEMQYAGFFDGIELIVPIPLHDHRMRERGYNQSEYIARGISEVTGIAVDTTHVVRQKDTPHQALQRGDERKMNVANAFAVLQPEQLYKKHILVVDDLITTGETMRSCLKAMKQIRGAKFSVFALCKAR